MSARGDDKNRLKAVLRAANAHIAKPRADFDNEQIEKTYARWAPFYDPAFAQILRWGRTAAVASANRHIGGRVLDVGVGTGLELPMFDRSLNVVGVDLSEPMLRRAARRARQADLRQVAGLARMDACRLAFEDARFDVVIAPFVLTVLPQPEASLDEWVRVLRPEGEIVLVNHIGAEQGPMARFEGWLGRHGASLGWRPEFPWSIIGNWLAARPHLHLAERRVLAPFGLFTLIRIKKTADLGATQRDDAAP
jgi:phosphatidylethanolamine/phosphatidyl-N-methylethanolamine N-methyltransferase